MEENKTRTCPTCYRFLEEDQEQCPKCVEYGLVVVDKDVDGDRLIRLAKKNHVVDALVKSNFVMADAARELNVTANTLRRWADDPEIKALLATYAETQAGLTLWYAQEKSLDVVRTFMSINEDVNKKDGDRIKAGKAILDFIASANKVLASKQIAKDATKIQNNTQFVVQIPGLADTKSVEPEEVEVHWSEKTVEPDAPSKLYEEDEDGNWVEAEEQPEEE